MNNESAPAGPAAAPSRARHLAAAIPWLVALAFAAVVAHSAWPLISPARDVLVVQAVFDQPSRSIDSDTPGEPTARVPTVQAPGWLEAEPFTIACSALVDGVVETVTVLAGEPVTEGQVVATLVDEDETLRLSKADADLAAAEAAKDTAAAQLAAAERTWESPIELERRVESGRAALAEARAELERWPSLRAAAQAALVRLEAEADRVRRSTDRGAATELERITADQRAAEQRSEVAALDAQRPILEARVARNESDLRAAERDLELRIEDRRRLDVARASLATAKAALARARAARDEAALALERTVILAPISGYVQRRLKRPGDKVVRGSDNEHSMHIVHVYDPSKLQVRVDVPLADAANIRVGQRCEVIVETLPDRAFEGVVLRSTHEADLQKNTLEFKVRIENPAPILRPDMLARVKFIGNDAPKTSSKTEPTEHQGRVRVPAQAIDRSSSPPTVWLVTQRKRDRGRLTPLPVNIINTEGQYATIEGPVHDGALIAVSVTTPKDGEPVRFQLSTREGAPS